MARQSKRRLIPEYRIWDAMKQRCQNPSDRAYPRYGGRGITICNEWSASFDFFYADMGPRPSKNHSLERVNNDLGYSKSNCKWATQQDQANNRRSNRKMLYQGELLTTAQIARRIGINYKTFMNRLYTGWKLEDAIDPKHYINQFK